MATTVLTPARALRRPRRVDVRSLVGLLLLCAAVGGTLLLCQFAMTLMGLGGDQESGSDAGLEVDDELGLRLVGLEETDAMPFLAAGAPDDLMQQLKRALGGTRVAVGQPEIGVNDADEVELGEMVPFGDELRADHDVEAALGHVVQLLPQPLHGFHEVTGQHQDARIGK